jgi:hypothetical protein
MDKASGDRGDRKSVGPVCEFGRLIDETDDADKPGKALTVLPLGRRRNSSEQTNPRTGSRSPTGPGLRARLV